MPLDHGDIPCKTLVDMKQLSQQGHDVVLEVRGRVTTQNSRKTHGFILLKHVLGRGCGGAGHHRFRPYEVTQIKPATVRSPRSCPLEGPLILTSGGQMRHFALAGFHAPLYRKIEARSPPPY